jgi:pimeloyl-ACP methyl ester carboxylesterase
MFTHRQVPVGAASIHVVETAGPTAGASAPVVLFPHGWPQSWHAWRAVMAAAAADGFDYFFDVLSPDPARISAEARDVSAEAYHTRAQLTAGAVDLWSAG